MVSTCPDAASLQQLLDGVLPAAAQAELSQHLAACPSCRAALDRLATGGRSFPDLAQHLQPVATAPEPGLQRVLNQAESSETQAESPAAADEELAFLAPPTRPGHIGRLGHYDILEVIGRGGFGIVLKAVDDKLQRVVAIKVLSPRIAVSATARKRFTREAQAAAAITHDHVVTIHAVEYDHNPPYFVMQCIHGISLQDKLDKEGTLGLKETLRIGLQAAEGLAAAHKQGLVHRDIKPANVLLENGVERVQITDFGLARAVDDASLTQSGVVAGTPMYMSPEQAAGEAFDHRSDLFSLGTVLYVMCTGRPPFRASGTHAVLKRVIDAVPRPIRETNPEVPDWLAAIIARLHAKKPGDRFQTAKEVADLLGKHLAEVQAGRVVHGEPSRVSDRVEASATKAGTWLGSPRRRWALAAAILLSAIGAACGYYLWPRPVANVAPATESGWISLFNGKDLAAWDTNQPDKWKVEDGAIVGTARGYLFHEGEFDDFECRFDAKIPRHSWGDFMFRHQKGGSVAYVALTTGISRNPGTLLFHKKDATRNLNLVDAPPDLVTADTWFRVDVSARGKLVEIKINGTTTAKTVIEDLPEHGRIGFGATTPGGQDFHFRKIEIKPLVPR
jgi:hypothetical protein